MPSSSIFFLPQNIMSIPDELIDAARVDGASEWKVSRSIILPLSISRIAAISIVNWVYTWSLFIWPLIVATSAEMFTMELGRMYFQQEYAVDYGGIMAACVDHFAACPPRLPGLPHPHHRGGGKPCTT